MEFLSILALIMLVMVGYAAGSTAVFRGRHLPPAILDLLLIAVIWTIALLLRDTLGRWLSVLIWTAAAGLVAFGVMMGRHGRIPQPIDPPAPTATANPLRRAWNGWSWFAAHMGNFQGRLLMAFFYFIIVTPFGLIAKVRGDMLHLHHPTTGTGWEPRDPIAHTLEEARQQG